MTIVQFSSESSRFMSAPAMTGNDLFRTLTLPAFQRTVHSNSVLIVRCRGE
jgi:hypothetical protein